jgi:hypothetical protein
MCTVPRQVMRRLEDVWEISGVDETAGKEQPCI